MKVFIAKLWVVLMILITLSSIIALIAGLAAFVINVIGWVPLLAVFGLGAAMTVLFKITAWADSVLEREKSK